MAAEGGNTGSSLAQLLFDEPYRFEFFQAVRLLERIYRERVPVGRSDNSPAREVVRFRTQPTLQFPASEIYQISHNGRVEDDSLPPEMTVAFMGLIGPLGVLPNHYTELVAERARYKDRALWEFLDLFNHRMISLFYRAWERYRFTVAYERGDHDQFTEYLFDIIGMGTRGLKGRIGLPDEDLLFYGGLIAQRPHSASAIEAILGDYFAAPARLNLFTGQWLALDEDSISHLGRTNNELGKSTVAGARVWDTQSKFRISFGPLTLEKFISFLPSGPNFKPATGLTRFLAGVEFDFDIQLILRAEEVPGCFLTTQTKRRRMLGWNTWLKTQPFDQDDSQVVLSVNN